MDNLKTNPSGTYLWQPPQTSLTSLLQPPSVPASPQQTPTSILNGLAQPVRRFTSNKNNYNYMQSTSQAAAASIMIAGSSPGGHLLTLGSPNPNVYRKRQPMNTGYSSGGYQHNGKRNSSNDTKKTHKGVHTQTRRVFYFDRLLSLCSVAKRRRFRFSVSTIYFHSSKYNICR